ncbi:MAG: hypothetical protein ACT4P4_11265 [Betaproteobacteria bacterium]
MERLYSGPSNSIERDAKRFFDLTFPSDEVHGVVRALSKRFGGDTTQGVILAEAVKGLGKSHMLLLAYHLLSDAEMAKQWATKLGYTWQSPQNAIPLVHKFTDRSVPKDALWLLIGEKLGAKWSESSAPNPEELFAAIGDGHLVLIFDELERGIQGIVNPALRIKNINFLQMLSEAANRDARVTLIAAVYDGAVDPGATLRRVPRIELRFRKTEDRASIVRHRLYQDAAGYDREAARALIHSYINAWKKFGVETPPVYAARMGATFPFLPDLVELVFTRITESGGFQGTRSALGLLGAMLDAAGEGAYLMSAAHCRLLDDACADRLQDLNPAGDLINCARSTLGDLATQPFAEAIASATLLASLVPGGPVGLSKDELIRHVVKPGDDPNDLHAALDAFRKYGTYFHERDGRYRFDRHENEDAKVQLNARKFSDDAAREQLIAIWLQEVFRDTNETVVFLDAEHAKAELQARSLQGRRFVLSPRRLSAEERHALYVGAQLRNLIVLIEPRDSAANLLTSPDLLAYARRVKAANELANSPGGADSRRRYEDIRMEEGRQLQRLLRAAGLVYVRIERWAEKPAEAQFEEEPLGQAASKAEVVEQLRTNVYPPSYFVEHFRERIEQFVGQRVEQVDRAYRSNLGYPVPLDVSTVSGAIRQLVEDPSRILGLKHQRLGGGVCGERVNLSQSEFDQAELAHPWPAALPSAPGPTTGPAMPPSGPTSPPSAPAPAPAAGRRVEERTIAPCASLGELRQQVAARLMDVEVPTIVHARFSIFTEYRGQELASLPSAYRGGLEGRGSLDLQMELSIDGPLTKAGLEKLCERLPAPQGATYSARIAVELETSEVAHEGQG